MSNTIQISATLSSSIGDTQVKVEKGTEDESVRLTIMKDKKVLGEVIVEKDNIMLAIEEATKIPQKK